MKSIRNTTLWQTPLTIKLIAIWFLILGIYSVWKTISPCLGVKCEVEICSTLWSLILAIVYFGIANGLVNRNSGSRGWAILFVVLGLLGLLFILAIVIFESQNSGSEIVITYNRLSRPQVLLSLAGLLALHVGMLFALTRSATKAFFMTQISSEGE